VAAAQARAAPWVGRLARAISLGAGSRAEDLTARITGTASLGWALATKHVRVSGNRRLAAKVNGAFWHFWERTKMTAENIRKDERSVV
jgi:hypothetical protein